MRRRPRLARSTPSSAHRRSRRPGRMMTRTSGPCPAVTNATTRGSRSTARLADATVRLNDAVTCPHGATACAADTTVSSTQCLMDTCSASETRRHHRPARPTSPLRPPPRHSPTSLQTVLGARGTTSTHTLDSFAHHWGRQPQADDDTRPGARPGRHRRDHLRLLADRLLGRCDRSLQRRDILLARRYRLRGRRDPLRPT